MGSARTEVGVGRDSDLLRDVVEEGVADNDDREAENGL